MTDIEIENDDVVEEEVEETNKPSNKQVDYSNRPLKYCIYKGSGAIQFALSMNSRNSKYAGVVYVEGTKSKGRQIYDWDNKISFALGIADIGMILEGLTKTGEFKIVHDPNAKTDNAGSIFKYFSFFKGEQKNTYLLKLNQVNKRDKEKQKQYTIPVTRGEILILRTLLEHAIVRMLRWDI